MDIGLFVDFKILNFSILTNIYSIYFTSNNYTQRVMKKLILLSAISLAVISCGKDDDSSNSNKLAKPTLLTPSNNATVVAEEFYNEFVWSNVANADQYQIQISGTSN